MNINIFQLFPILRQAWAFYTTGPKLRIWGHLILWLGFIALAQLSPIYGDILTGMVLFVLFTLAAYTGSEDPQWAILFGLLPILNLFLDDWLTQTYPDYLRLDSYWGTQFFSLLRLMVLGLAEHWLVRKLNWNKLYIPLLVIFLWIYYGQLRDAFEYIFIGQTTLQEVLSAVLIIFFGIFLAVLIIFTNAWDVRSQTLSQLAQLQIDEDYARLVKQQYEEMRHFRHDFKNVLISLQGMINAGDYASVSEYLDNQVGPSEMGAQDPLTPLIQVKNSAVRQVLYNKLAYASSRGIPYQLEILEEIDLDVNNSVALSKAVGILLDNAIEASDALVGMGDLALTQRTDHNSVDRSHQSSEDANPDSPQPTLMLIALINQDQDWIILISNAYQGELPNLRELNQSGVTTKGHGRGLGLANLTEIIDQEGWLLSTEADGHRFTQELIIPKEVE